MTHLVDFILLDAGIFENLLNGLESFTEQVYVQFLKLGARQGLREIVAVLEGLDFELSAHLAGKGALGLLDFTLELTEGALVLRDVGTRFGLVGLDEVVYDAVIEILTTKVGITSGSEYFEHTIINREERYIESTATEVVHDDLRFATLLIEAVRDGGGRGLVDNTENVEARNNTGILGRLALSVVKV
jgi:hypothetical protein